MNTNELLFKVNPTNYARGLYKIDIEELGRPFRGKVRDNWVVERNGSMVRLIITTDRQSAFGRNVCTIPGKGQISNLISMYWFNLTEDIIHNHLICVSHPNILLAKQATVIPVEVILRRYLARGSTTTSIYHNYFNLGRRDIYGIQFPDGLRPNQELPMGVIVTPTTKAVDGHDQELTGKQAREIVDTRFQPGTWKKIEEVARKIFIRAEKQCLTKGIILVDTKFEFGIDTNGELMIIDELLTPDGSRFWRADQFDECFKSGRTPEYDKDILIKWLKNHGFEGEGDVPEIDSKVLEKMYQKYADPYALITGQDLPRGEIDKKHLTKVAIKTVDDYFYAQR